jgi:hypothetical protein
LLVVVLNLGVSVVVVLRLGLVPALLFVVAQHCTAEAQSASEAEPCGLKG